MKVYESSMVSEESSALPVGETKPKSHRTYGARQRRAEEIERDRKIKAQQLGRKPLLPDFSDEIHESSGIYEIGHYENELSVSSAMPEPQDA